MSSCVNSIAFMTLAMTASVWQSLVHELISPSGICSSSVNLSLFLSFLLLFPRLFIPIVDKRTNVYIYFKHGYYRWTWSCPFEDIVRLRGSYQPGSCTPTSIQSGSKVRVVFVASTYLLIVVPISSQDITKLNVDAIGMTKPANMHHCIGNSLVLLYYSQCC